MVGSKKQKLIVTVAQIYEVLSHIKSVEESRLFLSFCYTILIKSLFVLKISRWPLCLCASHLCSRQNIGVSAKADKFQLSLSL